MGGLKILKGWVTTYFNFVPMVLPISVSQTWDDKLAWLADPCRRGLEVESVWVVCGFLAAGSRFRAVGHGNEAREGPEAGQGW